MDPRYELVIGLETHARIGSKTKLFCGCANSVELNTVPNSAVCPVCMGFPGMLPVVSAEAVDLAVRIAQALRCKEIHEVSNFDRKSYFYPDLPSGFQITQLFHPIAEHGEAFAFVDGAKKRFRIHRMHMENDAGKLVHEGGKSLVDLNRAGSPLVEIVTEPDFRSIADVQEYLRELQKNLRFCGGSDADMDKGQLRCDVNISVRKTGETKLNNRVELKNLNSFSAIGRAIEAEFKRQVEIYEGGGSVAQETRGWDDVEGSSHSLRSKEDAMDYRYFPEPDLPPLVVTRAFIDERAIAQLPIDRREKYLKDYKLLEDDARILSEDRALSDWFEKLVELSGDPKKSCSYTTTTLFPLVQKREDKAWGSFKFDVAELAAVIKMQNASELSSTGAKTVVETLFNEGGKAAEIVENKGLKQVSDTGALQKVVDAVLASSAAQIEQYKAGKTNLFGYFVGQCMKQSQGKGNPQVFTELIKAKIG